MEDGTVSLAHDVRTLWRAGAALLAVAPVLASCGSASSSTSSSGAAASTTTASSTAQAGLYLTSAISVDVPNRQVTLPIFEGRTAAGKTVWYVVTDSSDKTDATKRGVDYAPKLKLALGSKAVQNATIGADGLVHFPGTVQFGLARSVVAGPTGFPPASATPGAIGDDQYSPLITTDGTIVLNATQVANDTGQHNGVIKLDTVAKQVTLKLLSGFTESRKIVYLRLDASSPVVAALEESTLAKNLDAAPGLGSNDPATSARSAIIPIVNGARGKGDPNRQGLQSAVLGEGEPLNIQQSLPNEAQYSPIWDVTPAVWTDAAIAAGHRKLLMSNNDIIAGVQAGDLTSGGTGPANTSLAGLRAAGFISNCPTVQLILS